jgi:hypothetical protein
MTTDQDGNLYLAEVFNGRVRSSAEAERHPAKLRARNHTEAVSTN